jgi:hypothetical protein
MTDNIARGVMSGAIETPGLGSTRFPSPKVTNKSVIRFVARLQRAARLFAYVPGFHPGLYCLSSSMTFGNALKYSFMRHSFFKVNRAVDSGLIDNSYGKRTNSNGSIDNLKNTGQILNYGNSC